MRKAITILLIVSLLTCCSSVLADENLGIKPLSDGEIAGKTLAVFLGDPLVINMEKADSFDDINTRFLLIGHLGLNGDLGVAVRVSDSQMYFWSLDLTPSNLIKAKLVLDEDAPYCYVLYYEGNEIKDHAAYYKNLSSNNAYDNFKSEVERITSSLTYGKTSEAAESVDPILACFPGLSWGMTKDVMIKSFGKDLFHEYETDTGTSVSAAPEIFGEQILTIFVFNKDEKLSMFSGIIVEADKDPYLETLTQVYGTPHQTTLNNALDWIQSDIHDDSNGDCYAWKTDQSLIIMDSMMIQYWALY